MAVAILLLAANVTANAASGVVVYTKSGCSHYVVESPLGYALLEWFGGMTPETDDVIVGDFESFGMKELKITNRGTSTTAWVDEYWMSRSKAIEKISEKCR